MVKQINNGKIFIMSTHSKQTPTGFDDFLPFARPSISDEAIADVVDSLKSGWITTGPKVAAFEQALQDYVQAPTVLTVNSATSGLYLALQALNFEPGNEVITTPFTFVATLNVIELSGLKPVLVDIDPLTYNMNIDELEAKITPRTRAIMPVHFAGLPVDLDPLYALAKKHNLRVIEDCAHAIGAEYKNKKIGSFGDIQVFSFHPNKNMTTGEGGAIALRDEELIRKIKLLRFHGIDRDAWNRFGKSGTQTYGVVCPGHKSNMMDIQAALGIHQLKELDYFIERRTKLAKKYLASLSNIPGLILPQSPNYDHKHAWHLFIPRVDESVLGFDRSEIMSKLKEFNVGTGLHYESCHLHPYYRDKYNWKPEDFPYATQTGQTVFSLPLFPTLTDEQHQKVVDILIYLCQKK